MTTKETVRAILDRLPDNCSIDDVMYQLYVVQAVARGDADVAAGVRCRTSRWTPTCAANGCWAPPGSLG